MKSIISMKKTIFTIVMAFSFICLYAQDVEFTADRPGASTGPSTVGKGDIQLEQGMQYDGDGGKGVFTFSSTLLRYGLFDGMELRITGDAFIYDNNDSWKPAFTGVSIGTKIGCFEEQGIKPSVSLLANLAIPATGSKGFVVEKLAPSLYLLCENTLSDKLSLGYNVGAEWDGTGSSPITFLAACLGYSVTERLGCFVESYNYLTKDNNRYCADFGLNYMATGKLQFDVAANLDLRDPANYWAVSFGVVWQINK